MIALPVDNLLASLAALFGAVCLVTWPFFRTRRAMLLVQIGVTAGFGIHYALFGAETAAIANLLSGLQLLAFLPGEKVVWLKRLGHLLIPVMLLMSALTWSGLPSLCAVSGTILLAIGRMQADEEKLRIWVMAGTIPWLLHDLLVGSPIAAIDAISLLTGAYTVWRLKRPAHGDTGRRQAVQAPAAV
ncbi:YgjV family protein [Rhizobium sp. CG5]|uniref:YgjV family protein n=1 Tax=Rhizobium sp. CG5 TaxID=2726076 RepID=UPI0020333AFA|nr:YgjV family protein [Rhizobium sp. CG5]MCM2477312.1 YgjV family protein [Rhizobium sp. CG5]